MAETVIHRVEAPDGTIMKIEGPADATPEQITEFASKIFKGSSKSGDDKTQERIAILQDEFIKTERQLQAAETNLLSSRSKENVAAHDRLSRDMDSLRKELIRVGGEESVPDLTPSTEGETELTPPSESDFQANKARIAADLLGAGVGAGAAKVMDIGKNIGDTAKAIRQMPGALTAAQVPGMPPAAPMAGPQAPQAPGMARPVAGGPAGPAGGPAGPLTQMGGSGAYNYGKAFGLTDIEAGRALDMSKNPGGANDLINQRRAAMEKIQQMGGGYAENPRYGGIMTPEPSAGGGPRQSFVQKPGGMTQLPPTQPIPNAPPPPPPGPGPLSQMGGALKQGARAVMGSPVVSGALGGFAAMEGAQDAQNRYMQGDTTGAVISGIGAAGGAMTTLPFMPAKVLGTAIATASPLTNYLRDKLGTAEQVPELTEQERMIYSRPAFTPPQIGLPRRLMPRVPAPGTNLPPVEAYR